MLGAPVHQRRRCHRIVSLVAQRSDSGVAPNFDDPFAVFGIDQSMCPCHPDCAVAPAPHLPKFKPNASEHVGF